MATLSLNSLKTAATWRALAARYGNRLPSALSLLLLLLLAYLAAKLVWALVPQPSAATWQPAPVAADTPTAAGTGPDLAVIAKAELFGRYQAPANPSVTALANAPETQLNLRLLGILADRTVPQNSRALIAHGSGEDKPYALGQAIGPGVLLKAIFPDRVVLSRKGRLETLRLQRDRPSAGGPVNVPIAVASAVGDDGAKLSQIRTQLLANPSQAGNYIRVQPVPAPGGHGQLGYRIYPGPNRSAFQASGLHPGDLVTAVNGVPLSNPAQTLQLLSELSQAQQVSLTIQRGSQIQNVNLSFAQ